MKKKKVIKISPPENNFVIHYGIIDITLSFPDHKWLCVESMWQLSAK